MHRPGVEVFTTYSLTFSGDFVVTQSNPEPMLVGKAHEIGIPLVCMHALLAHRSLNFFFSLSRPFIIAVQVSAEWVYHCILEGEVLMHERHQLFTDVFS